VEESQKKMPLLPFNPTRCIQLLINSFATIVKFPAIMLDLLITSHRQVYNFKMFGICLIMLD
jgi:hypothetical protein